MKQVLFLFSLTWPLFSCFAGKQFHRTAQNNCASNCESSATFVQQGPVALLWSQIEHRQWNNDISIACNRSLTAALAGLQSGQSWPFQSMFY